MRANESLWTDEARAMARPIRTYRALASLEPDGRDGRRLAARVAFTLLACGAFVSLTAAGRLVASHVAFTALFWSFVPILQIASVAAVVRLLAPKQPILRAASLYFVGHGPWFFFMVIFAGICLFAPNVYDAMMWLLGVGILPGLLVVTFVWGNFLTWAFFRHGLTLSRGRAAAATALFYVGFAGSIFSYYYLTDQIRPQFFWTGR